MASRALDLMVERVTDPGRRTFGKMLVEHGSSSSLPISFRSFTLTADQSLRSHLAGTVLSDIAKSRAELEGARLLVISAANQVSLPQPSSL